MSTRWQHKKPPNREQQVADWNLAYAIGTEVTYETPAGEIRSARTTSGAFLTERTNVPAIYLRSDSAPVSITCPLALVRPKGEFGHA